MNRICLSLLVFVFFSNCIWTSWAAAREPVRIWVDVSGRYHVEAALISYENGTVTMRRKDGGVTMMRDVELSKKDNEYLQDYLKREASRPLEMGDPRVESPNFATLESLDLPRAHRVAEEGDVLSLVRAKPTVAEKRIRTVTPDPAPDKFECPQSRIDLDPIGSYDQCSPLVFVGDKERPILGVTINSGFRFPGSETRGKILAFNPKTRSLTNFFESKDSISILDHHVPSNQSLVLVSHDSLGQGGQLALLSGWKNGRPRIRYRRTIPSKSSARGFEMVSTVKWARMLDDENVIALMNDSIVRWNLVSGEAYYRLSNVHRDAIPALSGGRRYIAVPTEGAVNLFETEMGDFIGTIYADSKSLPSVGFAKHGGSIAIATTRRMRTWDLVAATESSNTMSPRNLGKASPVWIDHDLVLSGSGVVISTAREMPLWHYQVTGTEMTPVGDSLAFLRRSPSAAIAIFKLPHQGVREAMDWVDSHPGQTLDLSLKGRSVWGATRWDDRDVRIGAVNAASESQTR